MKALKLFCLSAAAVAVLSAGVEAGPLADATADVLWGIELGGFLDVSYIYNFNDPITERNGLRVFDTDHDEFNFQLFQFYIDKLPEEIGEVGFRADLAVGEDANLIAFDQFDSGDEFSLYQAFVSYIAPIGNGLTLDLGRWVAPYSYEVIEGPANDNYSRSFLFGFAVPKTHTGLRAIYPINDQFEIMGAVSQGWDEVEDDNDSLSHHAALRWTPIETFYMQNAVSYGPEMAGNNKDYTFLYDFVVSYTAMDQLTVGGNFDWAETENAGIGASNAEWWGVTLYGRYDFTEQVYSALRSEYFKDQDGIRTASALGPMATTGVDLWGISATVGYEVTDGFETRFEYRFDDADSNIFSDDSTFDDSQHTVAAEIIYSF